MVICDGKIGRTVVEFFGSQSATATAQESRPAKYYLYIGHSGADLLDSLTLLPRRSVLFATPSILETGIENEIRFTCNIHSYDDFF